MRPIEPGQIYHQLRSPNTNTDIRKANVRVVVLRVNDETNKYRCARFHNRDGRKWSDIFSFSMDAIRDMRFIGDVGN